MKCSQSPPPPPPCWIFNLKKKKKAGAYFPNKFWEVEKHFVIIAFSLHLNTSSAFWCKLHFFPNYTENCQKSSTYKIKGYDRVDV